MPVYRSIRENDMGFRYLALAATASAALLLSSAVSAASDRTVDRLWILDCGHSSTKDLSANWTPGAHQGVAYDFADHCYLIRHGERLFLWDTGMSDAIASKPEGVSAGGGLLVLKVVRPLAAQLAALHVSPDDITDLALSHFHSDHAGNAAAFARATHYVQKAERDAAFGPDAARYGYAPPLYQALRDNPTRELDGDFDVFGDGSVVILSTPGHTPGHQSLYVRLPKRGGVVLTGDLVHLEENWTQRRVPSRNVDRDRSLASMAKVAELLEREHAELWINHDAHQGDALPLAPEPVE
jgi:N-acyl homoserine lactone hydrolase